MVRARAILAALPFVIPVRVIRAVPLLVVPDSDTAAKSVVVSLVCSVDTVLLAALPLVIPVRAIRALATRVHVIRVVPPRAILADRALVVLVDKPIAAAPARLRIS